MQIVVSNLSYFCRKGTINPQPIVKEISFTIQQHDLLGIIGPSGAGKTTLAQLMAGLLEPSSGEIRTICPSSPQVGMVFQNPEQQFFEETLAKDARAGLLDKGWDADTIERNIDRAFNWVGLSKFLDRSPFSLSGGEKRLAAIACVLSGDPDIIIFDEPTASLDPPHRRQIHRLVRTLHKQGKIVCIVSQDLEWLVPLTNRLLLIKEGNVLWTGESAHLFSRPELVLNAGLELPEIPFIMKSLAESGLPVNTTTLRVRDAAEIISNSFNKK
jgi:energy-coupling factor transporter ATP-binding protein EcfA2